MGAVGPAGPGLQTVFLLACLCTVFFMTSAAGPSSACGVYRLVRLFVSFIGSFKAADV